MAQQDAQGQPAGQAAGISELDTGLDAGALAAEAEEYLVEGGEQRSIAVALCQVNPVVADLVGNRQLAAEWIGRAAGAGAQLIVFPELMLSGYPPEDLLMRHDFLSATWHQLELLAKVTDDAVVCIGFPRAHDGEHRRVHNSMAILTQGGIAAIYDKQLLPNYGVFDERRYFERGLENAVVSLDGVVTGLTVCEDIWFEDPVVSGLVEAGAELIVNISASPFHAGKALEREAMIARRAQCFRTPIVYCNLVGGQDELVFDGASLVVDRHGRKIAQAPQFDESLLICDVPLDDGSAPRVIERTRLGDTPTGEEPRPTIALAQLKLPPRGATASAPLHEVPESPEEEVYGAICLGIRDYIDKNGFPGVLVGVSGGIDSAVVLTLAADALGPERVGAVVMPSPYSSVETQADARALADALGVRRYEYAIQPVMEAFDGVLAETFRGSANDTTEENIQARIRGTLLMALSNKLGSLVLTTGNKSEMAVGYATLYGDMAGGFAPLKDVPKSLVFKLSRWRNAHTGESGPIPAGIIERPPSAELKHGQKDEDTLGSYDVLDRVIELYIEHGCSVDEIVADGADREYVERTVRLVDRAEYKRRQAPPGVKITTLAFGRDRRLPITARRRLR